MLFSGFHHTPWEIEYRRAILQITAPIAVDRESAFDRLTILSSVTEAIDHRRAQLELSRGLV